MRIYFVIIAFLLASVCFPPAVFAQENVNIVKKCPVCKRIFPDDYIYCPYDRHTLAPTKIAVTGPKTAPPMGQEWTEPITKMEFVWIPGGCFEMGCASWAGRCKRDATPVHSVCVEGFYIGKFEVTQGEWKEIMQANPSKFSRSGDTYPVEQVSWTDVHLFITMLKEKSKTEFRLPTEAEWEYAARNKGKKDKYSGGRDLLKVGWFSGNSAGHSHQVGSKKPNGSKLYDMSGNVSEWCQDLYSKNAYLSKKRDCPICLKGAGPVIRGGSWDQPEQNCTTTARDWSMEEIKEGNIGFRLVALPIQ